MKKISFPLKKNVAPRRWTFPPSGAVKRLGRSQVDWEINAWFESFSYRVPEENCLCHRPSRAEGGRRQLDGFLDRGDPVPEGVDMGRDG